MQPGLLDAMDVTVATCGTVFVECRLLRLIFSWKLEGESGRERTDLSYTKCKGRRARQIFASVQSIDYIGIAWRETTGT